MNKYVIFLFLLCVLTTPTQAETVVDVELDILARANYSKHNFTNLEQPYKNTDAFGIAKLQWWIGDNHKLWIDGFGPYLQVIPSWSTSDHFRFQRYAQWEAGLQWYPFNFDCRNSECGLLSLLNAARLHISYSKRSFLDGSRGDDGSKFVDDDWNIGFDYFNDNLDPENPNQRFWTYNSTFARGVYRKTNYSPDTDWVLETDGEIRFGPMTHIGSGHIALYGKLDWTEVSENKLFFQNYIKGGLGVVAFPFRRLSGSLCSRGAWCSELLSRFEIFSEYVEDVHRSGKEPKDAYDSIKKHDVRFGISMSTAGVFEPKRVGC